MIEREIREKPRNPRIPEIQENIRKSIKNIITTIFFLASIQSAFSNEIIIPLKKPSISSDKNNINVTTELIILLYTIYVT